MARKTALDYCAQARKVMGYPPTTSVTQVELLSCLNEAISEVFWEIGPAKFPLAEGSEVVATVSGTDTYEITQTAVVLKIFAIEDTTNDRYLRPSNYDNYMRTVQGDPSASAGTPEWWFESGVGSNDRPQLRIWPRPDGAYSLTVHYYYYDELVLSPSPTSVVFPRSLERAIQAKMNAIALEYRDHREAARYEEGNYARAISRAKKVQQADATMIHELGSYVSRETSDDGGRW